MQDLEVGAHGLAAPFGEGQGGGAGEPGEGVEPGGREDPGEAIEQGEEEGSGHSSVSVGVGAARKKRRNMYHWSGWRRTWGSNQSRRDWVRARTSLSLASWSRGGVVAVAGGGIVEVEADFDAEAQGAAVGADDGHGDHARAAGEGEAGEAAGQAAGRAAEADVDAGFRVVRPGGSQRAVEEEAQGAAVAFSARGPQGAEGGAGVGVVDDVHAESLALLLDRGVQGGVAERFHEHGGGANVVGEGAAGDVPVALVQEGEDERALGGQVADAVPVGGVGLQGGVAVGGGEDGEAEGIDEVSGVAAELALAPVIEGGLCAVLRTTARLRRMRRRPGRQQR